jgi:WD40 repeat protein
MRGAYRDSETRQAESYYHIGTAALEREAWTEARTALLAAGTYRDAKDLWKQSYGYEAEKTGQLRLWLNAHTQPITDIAFSPDGQILASSSPDGSIKLWRVRDGALLHVLAGTDVAAGYVAFSPDGTILMTSNGTSLTQIWQVHDGSLQQTIGVAGVLFSPDGASLASYGQGNAIKLWRLSDGTLIETFTMPGYNVNSVAFSSDGQTLAGSSFETIQLWSMRDGTLFRTIKPPTQIHSLALSQAGTLLALGSYDGVIQILRLPGDPEQLTFQAHDVAVNSMAFSPDGQLFASGGGDGIIKLWQAGDGKQLQEFPKQSAPVQRVVFSPDGRLLATADGSGAILIWRVRP